ncbi:MAG TPA: hypothetical protein VNJ04_17840 [Gemmatimonadaceae bacterium]|nr:hypothetical protein [Gemmatimonadaceae bacterium]
MPRVSKDQHLFPVPPPPAADAIPAELLGLRRFIGWQYMLKPGKNGELEWTKIPVQPLSGRAASSTDARTWDSFDRAWAAAATGKADGIGIVLGDLSVSTQPASGGLSDRLIGIDLDDCMLPDGTIKPEASAIVSQVNSYTEISPSGTGLHILVSGDGLPPGGRKHTAKGVEMYDQGRYFTLTGRHWPGTPGCIHERTAEIAAVHQQVWNAQPSPAGDAPDCSPVKELDDAELLSKAEGAGNGHEFQRLWQGDWSPDYPSQSEADAALVSILWFWTGDRARVDGLFRRSGLMRPKWDEPRGAQTYGQRTLDLACHGAVYSAARTAGPADMPRQGRLSTKSQSTAIAELASAQSWDLWHTDDGNAFVSPMVNGYRETHAVDSKAFRQLLVRSFYTETRRAPTANALNDAITLLTARARYEGPEREVFLRIAPSHSEIYLDLGDPSWSAVRIRPDGWSVVSDPPVRFKRSSGLAALPIPVAGETFDALRPFLNLRGDDDFVLACAWLVATFSDGPYPLLILDGEQGSAKTTTARILRTLVDPNKSDVRALPRDLRDLAIAADQSHVLAFDNLSGLSGVLSDGLCRLSTGGGFATRSLYENREEQVFEARRPILLNGINSVASRADLIDRAILLTLPTIPDERRRDEKSFWAAFGGAQPKILGAVLDAVAAALKGNGSVQLTRAPRMADFARWSLAAEAGGAWQGGRFLRAFAENRDGSSAGALDGDPLAEGLEPLAARGWTGTATELLAALDDVIPEPARRQRGWFRRGKELSQELRRLAPALRRVGIAVDNSRPGHDRRRIITITKNRASPASAPPQSVAGGLTADRVDLSEPASASNSARPTSAEYAAAARTPIDVAPAAASAPAAAGWSEEPEGFDALDALANAADVRLHTVAVGHDRGTIGQNVARVAFMITKAMHAELLRLGYADAHINGLPPHAANEIIAEGREFWGLTREGRAQLEALLDSRE